MRNAVASVRLEATNHDGLVLGNTSRSRSSSSSLKRGSLFADTCFGVDPTGEVAVGWDWGELRGEVTDIELVPDPSTLVSDPMLAGRRR